MKIINQPEVYLVGRMEFVAPPAEVTPGWEPEEGLPGGELLVEFGGRGCYRSWKNPAKRTHRGYVGNILDHKHFSVTEHAVFSLWIQGVSRSLSHEFVRHRHISPSQESQRYVPARDINFVLPVAYIGDFELEAWFKADCEVALVSYIFHLDALEKKFSHVEDTTARKKMAREAARELLPNAAETRFLMTGNVRSWREFFEKRGNEHADAQIARLAVAIFRVLQPEAPDLFQDIGVGWGEKTGREVLTTLDRAPVED